MTGLRIIPGVVASTICESRFLTPSAEADPPESLPRGCAILVDGHFTESVQ